jgi:hypothetical protein
MSILVETTYNVSILVETTNNVSILVETTNVNFCGRK